MFVPPLHPDFAALADFDMGAGLGTPAVDLPALRAAIADAFPPPEATAGVQAARIVIDAEPQVAVDTFAPTSPGPHPALIWLHGGGYVMGAPAMDGARMQDWADQLGCFVASVDYRLAPEHPFPAAHDDAVRALEWVVASAGELDVDVTRLVVGGASAGAGLAAGVALASRDRGIALAGQLLVYPMIDDRHETESSRWDAAVWSAASCDFAWRSYLGDLADHRDQVPALAAPARAQDLAGLPPAIVIVGGADRFLDEDLTYAARLTHAGVLTEIHVHAGAPHGFDAIVPESSISRSAVAAATDWLRERFAG